MHLQSAPGWTSSAIYIAHVRIDEAVPLFSSKAVALL